MGSRLQERFISVTRDDTVLKWCAISLIIAVILRRAGGAPTVALSIGVGDGLFIPILVSSTPEKSFREALIETRATVLEALSFVPSRYDHALRWVFETSAIRISATEGKLGVADIYLSFSGEKITARTQRLDGATLQVILDSICEGLAVGLDTPSVRITDLRTISPGVAATTIDRFNVTPALSSTTPFRELLLQSVLNAPDDIAIYDRDERISYASLFELAVRIARRLQDCGLHADDVVVLSAERNARFVVGVVGILFGGYAYCPMDPDLPIDRKKFLLASAKCLITADPVCPPGAEECLWFSLNNIISINSG